MRTIRRIYFYLVALVSLEVIVWGVVGMARTLLHEQRFGAGTILAGSLALTLVGLPVFLLHWGLAQRSAARDPEERAKRVRAVFFHAALVGTLIPVVQSGMALINRLLVALMRLPAASALVGGNQSAWDNLIALLVNSLAALYLYTMLQRDRRMPEALPVLNEVRRLFRVVWLLYGLGLTIFGVQMLVGYILLPVSSTIRAGSAALANAATLLAAGVPLWVFTWRAMQAGLDQPGERDSLLRWVVLYGLSLAGVGTVLTTAGMALSVLLRKLLGDAVTWNQLLIAIRQPLSLAIPLGGVWAYYGGILQRQIAQTPDDNRRAALRRLYHYILAAFGVGSVVWGLVLLCGYLVGILVQASTLQVLKTSQLANALAVLAVGLPLWLTAWHPMAAEARMEGEPGEHARRSPIRKTYLYLALFAGVIGSMVSAWRILSPLLNAWFGGIQPDLTQAVLRNLAYLVIFLVFLAYHWFALRVDGRAAAQALASRQAQYGVLILAPGEDFLRAVQAAVQRHAPHVAVTGEVLTQGAPAAEPGGF